MVVDPLRGTLLKGDVMGRSKVGKNGQSVNKRIVVLIERDLEERYDKMLEEIGKDRSTHIRDNMWKEVEAYDRWSK